MVVLGAATAMAQAQTAPLPSAPNPFVEEQRQQERERALRQQQERMVDSRLQPAAPPETRRLAKDESPCFRIDRIVLDGELAEDFQGLLAAAAGEDGSDNPLGRCLGTEGVNIVLTRLQQAAVARGYVTTRVLAAPQDLSQGTLTLTLIPGRIAAIRFADGSDARTSLASAIPARPGDLLNLRDIEQGLENLKRAPTAGNLITDPGSYALGAAGLIAAGPILLSGPGPAVLLGNGAAGIAGGAFNTAGQLFANGGDVRQLNFGEVGIATLTGSAGGAAQALTIARYRTGFGYGIGGTGTGGLSGLGLVSAINAAGEGIKPLVGSSPSWPSMSAGTVTGYGAGWTLRAFPIAGAWLGAAVQETTGRLIDLLGDGSSNTQSEGNR